MRGSVLAISALLLACAAAPALGAPEEDMVRQAAMAARFQPFDVATGTEWEAAFPSPFFRSAGAGQNDAVQIDLKPGAYTIVVLCNCEEMDPTLVGPNASMPKPLRSNEQGAMYSIDVPAQGQYLVGVDMVSCQEAQCPMAVKVYRKK